MRRAAVVQYRTSADSAEHNRSLIEDILIELGTCDPGGVDYQVFEFEDGVGFLHVGRVRWHHRPVRGLQRPPGVSPRPSAAPGGPAEHQPRGADRVVLRQQAMSFAAPVPQY